MEIEETTTVENNDCDFVDIGGAEQSLSHENRSWKFCNFVSLPSAEVVFFHTSLFHFHFALFIYFKIVFFVTQSQVIIMKKIISTKDRLFMSVSGPSGSSKTDLFFQMFLKGTFYPSYNKIFYFYLHDQPKYRSFVSHNKFDIEFIKLSSFEIVNNLRDCMIVFDDTCEEFFNEKDFAKLATAGRHQNVHVIYVKHNLFQQSKQSRTIDLNTTHLIFVQITSRHSTN